jgi:hypothetical protein
LHIPEHALKLNNWSKLDTTHTEENVSFEENMPQEIISSSLTVNNVNNYHLLATYGVCKGINQIKITMFGRTGEHQTVSE